MSAHSQLGREVLRDVSRSFYLSLRLLPKDFREPTSVGYLLARLSDTIADSGSGSERLEVLNELKLSVEKKSAAEGLNGRLQELAKYPGVSQGEKVLLQRGAEVFNWLKCLSARREEEVRRVVGIIVEGQSWDLTRFEGEGVTRLSNKEELENYTYQVAGCVGEFWTRVGFLYSDRFAGASQEMMEKFGRSYGQGLQLVNILRDLPEDLERGRCYLPGSGQPSPEELMKDRGVWLDRADALLDEGLDYCDQVSGLRVGVATGLPVLLGKLTLAKLRKASWEELVSRVKVSRSEVKRAGWCALKESARWGHHAPRWRKMCASYLKNADS